MSWVDPSAVRARWPSAPGDDAYLQVWIDDAEAIIRNEFAWVDDQLSVDATLQPVLTLVVARMVIRALATPFGVSTQTVGDTSVGYTAEGGLYLSDTDRNLIAATGPQAAFTVDGLPSDYLTDPSLSGAWTNGPDGYAPGELASYGYPSPANPDPAAGLYSPRQVPS